MSHNCVGTTLEKTGDLAGAQAEQWRNQEIFQALAAEHPGVPDYRRDLAVSHNRVGGLLTLVGRPAEGLDELERACSLLEVLVRDAPNVPDNRDILATTLIYSGDALREPGPIRRGPRPPRPSRRFGRGWPRRRQSRRYCAAWPTACAGWPGSSRTPATPPGPTPTPVAPSRYSRGCPAAPRNGRRPAPGRRGRRPRRLRDIRRRSSGLADQAMDDLRQAAATGRAQPGRLSL